MLDDVEILSLKNITKIYPGVVALDDVSLSFNKGEVHAIVGENGAGKSTLIKTIAGAITPEEGTITIDGKTYTSMNPKLSRKLGVEVIYQEFNLIGTLSAAENVCLGEEFGKLVNFKVLEEKARTLFEQFGVDIDPRAKVDNLSSAQRQIVEIAKAVSKDVRFLVMDEPTAPLSVAEVDILMEIITELKKRNITILYISHRLEEVFRIANRVSIMRDGKYVATHKVSEITRSDMISEMVGRSFSEGYPVRSNEPGEVVLEVKNLKGNGNTNISFSLHKGEILGFSGLVGSGRTELMRLIFGADPMDEGEIHINGKPVRIRSEIDAMKNGIGLIPEDRKLQGCILDMDVKWNISIANIKNISRYMQVNKKKEREIAEYYQKTLDIKTPGLEQKVRNLSGGNQQKVVIAKSLAANSDILIFDEPTRGIDVNAKHEIYLLMNELTSQGKSIIIVSSDMEELLGMSDRLIVLCEGRLAGEVPKEKFYQNYILELASGGTLEEAERTLCYSDSRLGADYDKREN